MLWFLFLVVKNRQLLWERKCLFFCLLTWIIADFTLLHFGIVQCKNNFLTHTNSLFLRCIQYLWMNLHVCILQVYPNVWERGLCLSSVRVRAAEVKPWTQRFAGSRPDSGSTNLFRAHFFISKMRTALGYPTVSLHLKVSTVLNPVTHGQKTTFEPRVLNSLNIVD